MLGYLHPWREHETRRIDAAGARLIAEVARCHLARSEQPQYAAFDLTKEAHPDVEDLRRELVAVVETAEHEAILRQAGKPAQRHFLCDRAFGVVDPVAVRQMHDFFAVMLLLIERQSHAVGQNVIYEVHAHRRGISEIADLDRRWTVGQDCRPRLLSVALQVDSDIDI